MVTYTISWKTECTRRTNTKSLDSLFKLSLFTRAKTIEMFSKCERKECTVELTIKIEMTSANYF